MTDYDVLTLGETMLRFTPPGVQRIDQAAHFELEVGGSESNTSVGLARLGLKVAWLSRLPSNPLGKRIARTLAGQGVDTSHVVWAAGERLGLYFVEFGDGPRPTQVTYDRADSAMSRMQPDELPAALFEPGRARHLHLTGITVAISQSAAATARRAVELAKAAGMTVSFDVNYRAKLWSPAEARAGCHAFAAAADIFFTPLRDAETIYGVDGDPGRALAQLQAEYPQATVILTLGAEGAIGAEPGQTSISQSVFPAGTVGRIGGGDAFTAGVLYGYLTETTAESRLATALRWGAAAAAFKYTIPGDMPLFEKEEVAALLRSGNQTPQVRR
ncbi:MAG: sugar kinase [Chloroflexi bacterium]|nr:MAG: sugar kinase [Chloroflexota bacterium]